jgi:hypothetical protein
MESNRQREYATEEDEYHSARREAIHADQVRRLRSVCANLSDEEFNKLVDTMTEQKLRSERKPF